MLFDVPFATSSVMIRAEALKKGDLRFDTRFSVAEDYDLWEKISRNWEIQLQAAEEIGLGTRNYNLIEVKIDSKEK